MDLDKAISAFGTAQMKIKQLNEGGISEAIREKKEQLTQQKQRLCQYLLQNQLTCVPFFTKDQKQPMYVRLQQKMTYKNVTPDLLQHVVTKAITRQTLQKCAAEFMAEQAATATKAPPSKKKKGANAKPQTPELPYWSEVLCDALEDTLAEDFAVTKVTAAISKSKPKGWKPDSDDGAPLLPVEVLKVAIDLNATDHALKTMTKMKTAKKRKYEEIKAEAMPVIVQHLQDPAVKRECEIRGLDGRTKTYEIKAVAKPDRKKPSAATAGDAAAATAKSTSQGVSAKALQDETLGVIEEHPFFSSRKFDPAKPPTDEEIKNIQEQLYKLLLDEYQVVLEAKLAKKAAAAAKKKGLGGVGAGADGDGDDQLLAKPPVVVKMQLKRAKVAQSDSASDDDDEDEDPEEPEDDAADE